MQTITLSSEVIESLLHAQQSVEVWLASLDATLSERKRYDRGFAPQVRLRNRLRVFSTEPPSSDRLRPHTGARELELTQSQFNHQWNHKTSKKSQRPIH